MVLNFGVTSIGTQCTLLGHIAVQHRCDQLLQMQME